MSEEIEPHDRAERIDAVLDGGLSRYADVLERLATGSRSPKEAPRATN